MSDLYSPYSCAIATHMVSLDHPAGRALTSDWSVNSFMMVVDENFLLVVLWIENSE